MMSSLKEQSWYEDLYDLLTIKRCLRVIDFWRDVYKKHSNDKELKGSKIKSNSEMSTRDVKSFCELSKDCRTMMISASATMNLSARSYFKVVKIARTIADLVGVKDISTTHLAEALQYRPKLE